ncbi:carnitine O-acetyltransferase YAT1, partial [Corchorus olitorius]
GESEEESSSGSGPFGAFGSSSRRVWYQIRVRVVEARGSAHFRQQSDSGDGSGGGATTVTISGGGDN